MDGLQQNSRPGARMLIRPGLLCLVLIVFGLGGSWSRANTGSVAAAEANGPFAKSYFDALFAGTQSAQKDLPTITKAGEAVAERLLAGGDLFIASVRYDFVSEGMGRSGGLILLKEYSPAVKLSSKDAVIFSWSNVTPDQELALARKLHATGAFVVGIGPKPPDEIAKELLRNVAAFLESSAPVPPDVLRRFKGQTYPIVSQQNLALLWTFTGELVSALTRQGHMPAMYQSVLVPGARERNLPFRHKKFHKEHTVPAIPAGQLGQAYLNILGELYSALSKEEVGSIEKAAQACMKVRRDGHQVYAWLISHYPHWQPGSPGDPKFIRQFERISGEVPPVQELSAKLKPGDLFFFLGYYRRPVEVYEAARSAGAQILEVISGMGKPATELPEPDYIIQPKWPFGDALVPVPNYDVKILPSSGVVQASIWWALAGSMVIEEEKTEGVIRSMKFAHIGPGVFQMGSETEDAEEKPVHEVTITRAFDMQTTEVTQAQWDALMERNPSEFKGADRPVDNVTWTDAQEFISKLNARRDGYLYRLPTEAEWEYSCRAGTKGEHAGNLDDRAWYLKNSGKQTHPVAQKQPNAWGLYDMNGNVWEWLRDYDTEYSADPVTDPQGPSAGSGRTPTTEPQVPSEGSGRVVRGCGWGGAAVICSCTFRAALGPVRRDGALGFRLVRTSR